ncbi:putative protein kinase TKL-CTR1-DRK-1 family [Medicago truncatula]|uniref:Uncharacterized protein n=1 Tax=Medicago truncatula TaxID=3880 RepID=A0A396JEV0_MEDTR|nr:putative protein kinase TKL-CTR1-DRK-1 family [Medicago truncatula]
MCAMALEDRPQLCGATSLGMGGFGKTLRIPQGRAIELLLSKEYDEKCDVFSYEVILWELLALPSRNPGK